MSASAKLPSRRRPRLLLLAALPAALAGSFGARPDEPEPGRTVGAEMAPAPRRTAARRRVPPHLRAAVENPARPDADRRRDGDRKPGQVLAFFGIEPGMQVGELMAGTGYYTEILAAAVGRKGNVYAQNNRFVLERYAEKPWTKRLDGPGLVNVVRLDREMEDPGFPKGLDVVLMIRFYHDAYWMKTDRGRLNRAVYESLRPGGIYGVLDHHAEVGSRERDVFGLHRVDSEMVKEEILAAGFVLEAESDLLRNPDDDRSVSIFADGGKNRDRTDRFLFRFRKPAE